MESDVKPIVYQTVENISYTWIIILTILFIAVWLSISIFADLSVIARNWPEYRCSPLVMPFASMFGYNTSENFNYCLTNVFNSKVGSATGPFATILTTIIKNMMVFLNSLNSLRMMLATTVGGISQVFKEFTARFKLIFSQVKTTSLRLQILMRRVFATMYSVLYMGLSTITVGLNFGDTVIFRFLDTFCFAPETLVEIIGKGQIPIAEVKLGDVFQKTGAKVTSTYRFGADGQPMVNLKGIEVSTNHFIRHKGKWIPSVNHPDAHFAGSWNGGSQRPLICLDTDTHEIPIGDYIFSDWDESADSDKETMELAEQRLNGGFFMDAPRSWLYQPAVSPNTNIQLKSGNHIQASQIKVGDILTTGRVIGLGKRYVPQWVTLPTGEQVTPSTLLWYKDCWKRAGHLYSDSLITSEEPIEMITFVIMKTACLETKNGIILRDMCEVHSPDMETPTKNVLDPKR
jgi:hypothetical protein